MPASQQLHRTAAVSAQQVKGWSPGFPSLKTDASPELYVELFALVFQRVHAQDHQLGVQLPETPSGGELLVPLESPQLSPAAPYGVTERFLGMGPCHLSMSQPWVYGLFSLLDSSFP